MGELKLGLSKGHKIQSLEFSPVDKLVLTACSDGTIRINSIPSGQGLVSYRHDGMLKAYFLSGGTQCISWGNVKKPF